MFFLGEIFVDLALPPDEPAAAHCGRCTACIEICPTQAIVAPYRLDARRCISYLTIEHTGAIAPELRPLIGNRIYGCDDCQLVCPWNKFAQRSTLPDFDVREGLDDATLLALWAWREADFLQRCAGSPIRRIGWTRWRRNLAVALMTIRHLLLPAWALMLVSWLALPPAQQVVIVAFAALPTASSAYVLAVRMGGHAGYTAGLVTVSTLIGMAALPLWLAAWRGLQG